MMTKILIIMCSVTAIGFLAGCAEPKRSFAPQEVGRIVVLPFIDNRAEADAMHDFAAMASVGQNEIVSALKFEKKYRVLLSRDVGNASLYSARYLPKTDPNSKKGKAVDYKSVDPMWVRQLGPRREKWILVPALDELSRKMILLQTLVKARVSLYLYNKETGRLVWDSTGRSGGFPTGIAAEPLLGQGKYFLEKATISGLVSRCLERLPERGKPYLLPE